MHEYQKAQINEETSNLFIDFRRSNRFSGISVSSKFFKRYIKGGQRGFDIHLPAHKNIAAHKKNTKANRKYGIFLMKKMKIFEILQRRNMACCLYITNCKYIK